LRKKENPKLSSSSARLSFNGLVDTDESDVGGVNGVLGKIVDLDGEVGGEKLAVIGSADFLAEDRRLSMRGFSDGSKNDTLGLSHICPVRENSDGDQPFSIAASYSPARRKALNTAVEILGGR
jgi:hypothetical protein